MNKRNAREKLIKYIDQFHKTTGELVGITFTWAGSLEIVGPIKFSEFIKQNKEEAGRGLALSSNFDRTIKPVLDIEMFNLLHEDSHKCSQERLRK